jgi:type I restriction enzyme S subunit
LNQPKQQTRDASATLGHESQNTSSPEGTKEGGALPAGWQYLTLGRECHILAGFGFPERFQGKSSGDLPFFKVGDISEAWKRGEVFLSRAKHYVSHAESRELRAAPLPANTTVFAKIGAAIALNRRAILSEPSLVDNNVMGLHPASDNLNYKFLFHFVCTLKLDELSRATTVPSIRRSDIEPIPIPVPPPAEQRRIVAEIEKQFTRLEAGVAALRRVQANLKRYRAAVLKAACEGRLVPTEAELARVGRVPPRGVRSSAKNAASGDAAYNHAPYETGEALLARNLTERRQNWQGRGKYKEPAAPDTTGLPPLPAAWAWATVEQLAAPEPNSITDGPFGSNLKTEHYMDNGPRVIRLQNIGDGVYVDEEAHISQAHFERLQKHRVFANDVVIAGFGENPPRSCIIPEALGPAIVKADCIRFKPHSSVTPKYMNAALNSEPVRKRTKGKVHGVGRPRLNLGEIKSIVLPVPPLAEQTRIVAEVERRLSVVEELEAVVSANLQRAVRLRQSILQKAFTGQLA